MDSRNVNGQSQDLSSLVPSQSHTARIGVLGCGYWGAKHVRVLRQLEVDAVVAIDSDPRKLAAVRQAHPGIQTFTSLDDALDSVDAVVIATPPSSHEPLAMRCLAAGKDVLVEKPLATTAAGAARLVDAAARYGRIVMVGHTFAYNSAVWKMQELVSSGALGRIYYIDSARLNLGLYQPDVNVILDLAPHDVSILRFLLGTDPDYVEAWGSRHAHTRFEDIAYLRLQYADSGIEANIHVSWLDPHKVRRLTVVGSEKMAVYNDLASEEPVRVHDKGVVQAEPIDRGGEQLLTYRYGDITSPYVNSQEPLAVQDGHFADCVRSRVTPRTSALDGLAVARVLEAAQRSLGEKRRIALADVEGGELLAAPALTPATV